MDELAEAARLEEEPARADLHPRPAMLRGTAADFPYGDFALGDLTSWGERGGSRGSPRRVVRRIVRSDGEGQDLVLKSTNELYRAPALQRLSRAFREVPGLRDAFIADAENRPVALDESARRYDAEAVRKRGRRRAIRAGALERARGEAAAERRVEEAERQVAERRAIEAAEEEEEAEAEDRVRAAKRARR